VQHNFNLHLLCIVFLYLHTSSRATLSLQKGKLISSDARSICKTL